jgi:hypothetical protein
MIELYASNIILFTDTHLYVIIVMSAIEFMVCFFLMMGLIIYICCIHREPPPQPQQNYVDFL